MTPGFTQTALLRVAYQVMFCCFWSRCESVVYETNDCCSAPSSSKPLALFLFAIQLYVSKDLGDTWVFMGSNISRYRWRVLDEEFESNTSLYFEKDINGEHNAQARRRWAVADYCAYLAWAEPEAIADAFNFLRCLP